MPVSVCYAVVPVLGSAASEVMEGSQVPKALAAAKTRSA
jgi:hypothetical protein